MQRETHSKNGSIKSKDNNHILMQALPMNSDFVDWVSCGIKGPSIKP